MDAVATDGGGRAVLSLAGDVDTATVPRLSRIADELLRRPGVVRLAVDFANNTFIDSMGLGLLVRLRRECAQREVALALFDVPHRVLVMLRITGLSDAFTIEVVPL